MNIVITGVSSGIGKYLTEYFLSKNNNVYGLSRKKNTNDHPLFTWHFADVTDIESIKIALSRCPYKTIDVLICGAGDVLPIGNSMQINPADWARNISTNLVGTFNTIHTFFPLFQPSNEKRGKIFCFAGGGGTSSRPMFSAYACSKTGVIRLVEVLDDEWKAAGTPIDITAISPGLIKTQMTENVLTLPVSFSSVKEYQDAQKANLENLPILTECLESLISKKGYSGKSVSSIWDDWKQESGGGVLRRVK